MIASDRMRLFQEGGRSRDLEWSARLRQASLGSDDELSDAIAECVDQGMEASLGSFLQNLPDLTRRRVALDTAIEFAAKLKQARGMTLVEAYDSLKAEFPDLARHIQAACLLSDAMKSTSSVAIEAGDTAPLTLPCFVGPVLADGQGRYSIHQTLGVGSQGVVYLAADRALSEMNHPALVAVKRRFPVAGVLTSSWNRGDEATKARRVIHPNVVRTLDRFIGPEGAAYIVQEYVPGGTLQVWRRSMTSQVPERAAAEMVMQIARGVHAAHSAGLVHRDLKPGNVLMTAGATPKVADFGVAAAEMGAGPSERLGSLAFIAPEQYRLEYPESGADVYSLGGILYWILTDRYPNGQTPEETAAYLARSRDEKLGPSPRAFRPGLDPDLEAICRRALAPDRRSRHASADGLANDLESWLRGEVIPWTRPSAVTRFRKAIRRSPVPAAVLGVLLLVFGGLMGLAVRSQFRLANAQDAFERSEQLRQKEQDEVRRSKLVADTVQLLCSRIDAPDSIAGSWLTATTALETVVGPCLLTPSEDGQSLWRKRIDVVRNEVERLHGAGQGDHLECLLDESCLCVWLAAAGDGAECQRRLGELLPRLKSHLVEDDGWMVVLQTCQKAAEAMSVKGTDPGALARRARLVADARELSLKLRKLPIALKQVIERAERASGRP